MKAAAVVLLLVLLAAPAQARADDFAYRAHVEAAAARFDLPADLLWAVLRVESGGQVRAVSRAGAMGLMQLMPTTWQDWRERLALGADPFDPRDNIMAGAAYLRWLRDRYGAEGALAAYNAGPGGYEQSLAGRPLPAETRDYVARLVGLGGSSPALPDWRQVGLFAPAWSRDLGPGGNGPGLLAPRVVEGAQ